VHGDCPVFVHNGSVINYLTYRRICWVSYPSLYRRPSFGVLREEPQGARHRRQLTFEEANDAKRAVHGSVA
jgi:hypothetical protein